MVEQRIINSELHQDACLITIEKASFDFTSWHQEHEGIVRWCLDGGWDKEEDMHWDIESWL
jgi:hypothetical protein